MSITYCECISVALVIHHAISRQERGRAFIYTQYLTPIAFRLFGLDAKLSRLLYVTYK